jgi:putative membrane protein
MAPARGRRILCCINKEIAMRIVVTLLCLAASAGLAAAETRTLLDKKDREFIEKAAAGSAAEIELGNWIENKAASEAVREFGRMMARDHGQASERLREIAAAKGVTIRTEPDRERQTLQARLAAKDGVERDREYLEAMIDDHERDIALFKKAADDANDPDVRAFAESTVPTLKMHLDHARAARKELRSAQ